MTFDKLIVFGKTCSKVTSDEEIDDLGHNVELIHTLNYEVYVNRETDHIIEVLYSPAQTYSITIDDIIGGEEEYSLAKAEENIREKIFNKFEYFQKLMAAVA